MDTNVDAPEVSTPVFRTLRTEVQAALAAGSPQLSLRLQKLQTRALQRVLRSSEWLTGAEVCKRGAGNPGETHAPDLWRRDQRIFSIRYQGQELYPRYALDDSYRPLPIMSSLLRKFGANDPWRIAIWFESANGWLGHERPRCRLHSDPVSVLRALQYRDHAAHG